MKETSRQKKVLYLNYDVSGGVEYSGGVIGEWINELGLIVYEIKNQDSPTRIFRHFETYRPDMVVINELFDRSTIPTFYYRMLFPNTRVVVIAHSWKEINHIFDNIDYKRIHDLELLRLADCIICLNYNIKHQWNRWVPIRIMNKHMPCNPNIFYPKVQWEDREKLFCYAGQIHPLKFSEKFIDLLSGSTAVKIDCYGNMWDIPEMRDYNKKFTTTRSISYKGNVAQERVAEILNQYKFYVMPHTGYELFNFTLMQAIFCGTIPLVSLDRISNTFDHSWIDWTKGLANVCNTEVELFNNLREIQKAGNAEFAKESKIIVERANERFSYSEFKKQFQEMLLGLVPNRR